MNPPISVAPVLKPGIKPVVLVILDGFGVRKERDANAIRLAHTPTFDALYAAYPSGELSASGLDVGLPEGQMGNSEVGHLNLGAGRVVYQDITRINKSIADGDFFENPRLVQAVEAAKASGGALHLFGLTSPGGVHSSLEHAYAVVELCRRRGLGSVYWHAFLDGRDTPPRSAAATLREVQARLSRIGVGRIASVVGRFYSMDRDQRWERVAEAYRLLRDGVGQRDDDPVHAVEESYRADVGDEFVGPVLIVDGDPADPKSSRPVATVRDGDAVVFFNFRSDRARELTAAFTQPAAPRSDDSAAATDGTAGFSAFRGELPRLASYVCMCQYDLRFGLPVAFPPQSLTHILGDTLAAHGLPQLRTAETEKYAHVTFFFNGGVEQPFPLEDRKMVPSNREVATYDRAPAMSAVAVTDGVVAAIDSGRYPFVLVNFANPDMVGHTGMLEPAVSAVETVDACLGRIAAAARARGAAVLITADHGNCEQMVDPTTGQPHTAHTTNPVPFLVVDDALRGQPVRAGGKLCDVAPTVLSIMGLPIPAEMDGRSLLPQLPSREPQ